MSSGVETSRVRSGEISRYVPPLEMTLFGRSLVVVLGLFGDLMAQNDNELSEIVLGLDAQHPLLKLV